jgi:EAL domain-containing protein (putative c-di-GMP-specific phosphodiesterase class I)
MKSFPTAHASVAHPVKAPSPGVETASQRERLIAFGCELGQGFLFAKALEPEAARALLVEQQRA